MAGVKVRGQYIELETNPGETCTIKVAGQKGIDGSQCVFTNKDGHETAFMVSDGEPIRITHGRKEAKDPSPEHLAREGELGGVLGGGKLKMRLVPMEAIKAIARVFTWSGSGKYKDWDWLTKYTVEDCIESAWRHLVEEGNDPESGLPHLEHALTRLAMAVHLQKKGDRSPPKGPTGSEKLRPVIPADRQTELPTGTRVDD